MHNVTPSLVGVYLQYFKYVLKHLATDLFKTPFFKINNTKAFLLGLTCCIGSDCAKAYIESVNIAVNNNCFCSLLFYGFNYASATVTIFEGLGLFARLVTSHILFFSCCGAQDT